MITRVPISDTIAAALDSGGAIRQSTAGMGRWKS
jgi:hypothetical protein